MADAIPTPDQAPAEPALAPTAGGVSDASTKDDTPAIQGTGAPEPDDSVVPEANSQIDTPVGDAATDVDDRDDRDDEGGDPAQGPGSGRRSARAAALEREGEVAADFLERLLDIADLDGDIDVDIERDRASVAIVDSEDGRVPRRLVGPDGRVLDALQELTRLAVQADTGERSRLMLDIAGHRAARREAVVADALAAVETVKSTGSPLALDPMPAFERKVAHDAILRAGLASESEGIDPHRHVVVLPA